MSVLHEEIWLVINKWCLIAGLSFPCYSLSWEGLPVWIFWHSISVEKNPVSQVVQSPNDTYLSLVSFTYQNGVPNEISWMKKQTINDTNETVRVTLIVQKPVSGLRSERTDTSSSGFSSTNIVCDCECDIVLCTKRKRTRIWNVRRQDDSSGHDHGWSCDLWVWRSCTPSRKYYSTINKYFLYSYFNREI